MGNQNTYETVFVGREGEMSLLCDAWERVQNTKTPLFVFIQGDVGMGKTTLVKKFLTKAAEDKKALIGSGSCLPNGGNNFPFTEALNTIIDKVHGKKILIEQIGNILLQVAPAWLDLLSAGRSSQVVLAVLETVKAGREVINTKKFSQNNVNVQYANLVNEISQKYPLILFIDDFQWADSSTLEQLLCLSYFVQEGKFMFIATHRPITRLECDNYDLFQKIVCDKLPRNQLVEIELEDGLKVEDYLSARYPANGFTKNFIKEVEQRTAGHPFFLNQLFIHWETIGVIRKEVKSDGSVEWVLTKRDAEFLIPKQLTDLMKYRWENLEENLKPILQCASVEGEEFAAQVAIKLLQLEDMQIYSLLEDNLKNRQKMILGPIDQDVSSEDLDYYKFTHRFIRDFIYNTIPHVLRKKIHKQVGEALENLYPNYDQIAGDLALHFKEAGDYLKSANYMLAAAQYMNIQYSWSDGESWCINGLELVDKLLEKKPWSQEILELKLNFLETSGLGFYICTKYSEAYQRLLDAVSLAQEIAVDEKKIARMYLDLADISDFIGCLDKSEEYYTEAQKILDNSNIQPGEMNIELSAGFAYLLDRKGETETALTAYEDCIKRAKTLPQTIELQDRLAYINNLLGIAYGNIGQFDKSTEAFNASIQYAKKSGNITYEITPLLNQADDGIRAGKLQQSLRLAARALERATKIGDQDNIAYAHATIGTIQLKLGEIALAKKELLEAVRLFEILSSVWAMQTIYADLAVVFLKEGNLDTAMEHANKAVEYGRNVDYELELGYALDALAQVEVAKGQYEMAEAHFKQAIEIHQNAHYKYYEALSKTNLAALLKIKEQTAAAEAMEKEAKEIFSSLKME